MKSKRYKIGCIRCNLFIKLNKMLRTVRNDIPISFCINTGVFLALILMLNLSCKKLVQIPAPTSSITTSETFNDRSDANAAIMGIYAQMINTSNPAFASGAITLDCGLSSDELVIFNPSPDVDQVYTNALTSENGVTDGDLWEKAFPVIYQANACIEGIQSSNRLSQSDKNQFIGEAKFLRAFCYFYLINLYGDVPYITSTAWAQTSIAPRASKSKIYENIISDLKDAQSLLKIDYSMSNGERIRANQAAATALLARVYLYIGDYSDATIAASNVLNNKNSFSLVSDLNGIFLKNSTEAILQWNINPSTSSIANMTPEGYTLIPSDNTSPPTYYLSAQILGTFETGDQRKVAWIDSTNYDGTTYYYPYKYKIGPAQYSTGAASEYYMVLRLAEQYLIRAEAEAQSGSQQNLGQSVADLNMLRNRAGLPNYSGPIDQTSLLTAIYHERRIELFAEWGHRWLDLKRTNQVDAVMSIVTSQKNGGGTWNSYQQLYPIPQNELTLDHNLTQNAGY